MSLTALFQFMFWLLKTLTFSNKVIVSLLQTMYPSVQATIWGNVGKVTELLDTVLDCFIKVFSHERTSLFLLFIILYSLWWVLCGFDGISHLYYTLKCRIRIFLWHQMDQKDIRAAFSSKSHVLMLSDIFFYRIDWRSLSPGSRTTSLDSEGSTNEASVEERLA